MLPKALIPAGRRRPAAPICPAGRRRSAAVSLTIALFLLALVPGATRAQSLIAPAALQPGDPLLAWVRVPAPLEEARAILVDSKGARTPSVAPFFMPAEGDALTYGVLLAVPLNAAPGPATLLLDATAAGADGTRADIRLESAVVLSPRKFVSEKIELDKANTALRTAPDPARDAESQSFAALFALRDPTALFFRPPMTKPLETWRTTSTFGDRRLYSYFGGGSDMSVHGGLDLGAPTGTPVRACAQGRVVFAAPRILTGLTVVLEHLPGLFSIHMHLSRIDVSQGDIVQAGAPLGAVGSTGFSTGPHLHWELRIGNAAVNPEYWLPAPARSP